MRSDVEWEELSPSTGGGGGDVGISGAPRRRSSFSYYRLHEPLLRLSVLKLDGTSFEVRVARTAMVSELKAAVENVFKGHTEKDGGPISWSHVWGNFCLSYEDYKLVDDRACLKHFGVKDGDQLCFVRLLSLQKKRRSKSYDTILLERNIMSLAGPEVLKDLEEESRTIKNEENSAGCSQREDEQCLNFDTNPQGGDMVVRREAKSGNLLRRWLSSSKLRSFRKKKSDEKGRVPKTGKYF